MARNAPKHSEQVTPDPGSDEQQRAVAAAIEQHWEELLIDARVWVRSQGLQGDLESLAWDTLQEAIATALRCAGRYDVMRAARPWLRKILFNTIRTARRNAATERKHVLPLADAAQGARRVRREHGPEGVDLSEDELLGILGASTDADSMVSQESFEELLALVSEADREVLRLAYGEGLPGAALGTRLGISDGAAYTRLSRARAHLRAAYREVHNNQQDDS